MSSAKQIALLYYIQKSRRAKTVSSKQSNFYIKLYYVPAMAENEKHFYATKQGVVGSFTNENMKMVESTSGYCVSLMWGVNNTFI